MNKFYITTPIYYATAKPHIGHAFATIYADVIARYKKLKKNETFFTVGTDEHGINIEEKAIKAKKLPRDYVDEINSFYKKTWQELYIDYDDFIRTTEERHKKGVEKFINKLIKSKDVYKQKYEGLYCSSCEKFLTEKDLVNGLCPDHLKAPQKLTEENYFFNLKKYLPEIRKKIIKNELRIRPEARRKETLKMIDSGLADFSISREKVKWGIGYPGDKTQTVYVWVEALMNYVTILDFPDGEKFKKFWPANLHIIGVEINKFHTIFWPALLLAIGESLPKEIFIHGLFTVNGQKMSKTIGNIIDPMTLIEKFGSDAVRYLLLSQFPASEHGDIKEELFIKKYNANLANGIGNLFERIFTLAINYKQKSGKNCDDEIKKFQEKTEFVYKEKMENYLLYEALNEVFFFVKKLDQYIDFNKPWVLFKEKNPKAEKVLETLLFGAEKIIVWLSPFMPIKMEQAKKYLLNLNNQKEKLNLFPRL
ncbi:methionine--tRNA ligase [Candidatus Wolfebacteria bacterium]|nr:methionine--tRNA ligase [Candidatus Wolfebacteria bacterium]